MAPAVAEEEFLRALSREKDSLLKLSKPLRLLGRGGSPWMAAAMILMVKAVAGLFLRYKLLYSKFASCCYILALLREVGARDDHLSSED